MSHPLSTRRPLWLLVAILIATGAVYLQTFSFDFIHEWDDKLYVVENRFVRAGLTWDGLLWALSAKHACNWHPITWLSLMGDVSLFGVNAGAMHGMAVGLHLLNVILVYLFVARASERPLAALLVSALFALHPLHVESVAWISERKDLLSTGFWFLTLLLYLDYARHGGHKRYLLTLGSFTLGLLAKPMLVTLPFVLLLLDLWPLQRLAPSTLGRLVQEKLPFFILAGISSAITLYVQNHCGAVIEIASLPPEARIENALVSYVLYMQRMFWPEGLAFFYPHPNGYPGPWTAACALLLAGLSALAVQQVSRRPWLAVGWFFFLGTLVPVIGLVQVGSQGLADRYTYIPLTGLFLILAMLVTDAPWSAPGHPARPLMMVAMAGMLATLGWASHQLTGYWKDRETLYQRAIAVTERNYLAHAQIASMREQDNRLEEAIDHAQQALAYNPSSSQTHVTLGNVYRKKKEFDRAREHYAAAITLFPSVHIAYYNMGILFYERHRLPEAAAYYRAALERKPEDPKVLVNLAAALFALGRAEESLPLFQAAVRHDPDALNTNYNMARVLEYFKRTPEALPFYAKAVALDPKQEKTQFFYGKALLASGEREKAREHLTLALYLNPSNQEARTLLEQAGGIKVPQW